MDHIKTPKQLNKMILARQSIKRALGLLPLILNQNNDDAKSTIYGALCIYYARPFTESNKIGSLPKLFVSKEFHEIHCKLIKFRHNVVAHSDGDFEINDEIVNSAHIISDGENLIIEELYPYPDKNMINSINELLEYMDEKLSSLIMNCLNTNPVFQKNIPSGNYVLTLNKNSTWLEKKETEP